MLFISQGFFVDIGAESAQFRQYYTFTLEYIDETYKYPTTTTITTTKYSKALTEVIKFVVYRNTSLSYPPKHI